MFTYFRIIIYPATVFAPGCLAPAPVSIKKNMETETA
jgi:hypothetical protein